MVQLKEGRKIPDHIFQAPYENTRFFSSAASLNDRKTGYTPFHDLTESANKYSGMFRGRKMRIPLSVPDWDKRLPEISLAKKS